MDDGLFHVLASSVDELVFIWRHTGEMLWINDAFVRETGLTLEDFGFRNEDNPFVHPDDLPRVVEQIAAFVASDETRSAPVENRYIDAWGRPRALLSTLFKIEWHGEPVVMCVAKHIEPAGQRIEADQRYRDLVEAADDGIIQLAKDGRIIYSNRRFQQLTGARPVELARRAFVELLHADDRALASEALEHLRRDACSVAFEARLDTPEEPRWLAIHVSPVGERQAPVQMLAIARDITEARALEDRLRQRQRLESLGVLVGGIAHDLNNIVTVVLANAGLAEQLAPPGGRLTELLGDIRVAGERARSLSSSLLAYAGQAPTTLSVVDIDRIVDETLRLVGALTGARVQFVRSGGNAPAVRADAIQLGQVVMNLLTNAADAMTDRTGSVAVETGTTTIDHTDARAQGRWLPDAPAPGRYASILVRDTGAGMAPETVDRIFEPFFSTKGLGRGLGLSALLGIVESHRGHLCVATALGRGTTFRVLLPAAQPEVVAVAPAEPAVAPAPAATGAILVVDDEPMIRNAVRQILESEGYEVALAADGPQALTLFDAAPEHFAAAIVDFAMPGMDGNEVIRRLRARRGDLPVIQASGWRDSASSAQPLEGVVQLAKPFKIDELLDAVSRIRARRA